ncbi:MAG: hypothetical protein DRO00_04925 [Thermoproteota archaeon]|nr:MAG: hypothetical protein DRN90_03405 [Candidatus Korarchaeota archaeon]RLG48727.1 MAG: hypothetical protein DRN92_00395 [Candidatus Korarchaeota archaeon]RLG52912.1 MAG: hypothetical protein DRO00_04925 [Candidatus Korarchaeota archaeon]
MLLGLSSNSKEDSNKKISITRLVFDVVKPHKPDIVELSEAIAKLNGVKRVDIDVKDYDSNIERLRLVTVGDSLDLDTIKETIRRYGGNVASLDGVSTLGEHEEE